MISGDEEDLLTDELYTFNEVSRYQENNEGEPDLFVKWRYPAEQLKEILSELVQKFPLICG